MEKVIKKQVILMKSSWMENLGNGKFAFHSLPLETQMAPVYGIYPMDINDDGYITRMFIIM